MTDIPKEIMAKAIAVAMSVTETPSETVTIVARALMARDKRAAEMITDLTHKLRLSSARDAEDAEVMVWELSP